MFAKKSIISSFSKVKPLKISGVTTENGVQFKSQTGGKQYHIDNPLETLIGSLAACELSTMRAITRKSGFKIHSVKFIKIQSGLDLDKFMKGGPQDKIQPVYIQAEVQSSGTQKELDQWLQKALHGCPVYQMLKSAGVKVQSKWTNVKTLP